MIKFFAKIKKTGILQRILTHYFFQEPGTCSPLYLLLHAVTQKDAAVIRAGIVLISVFWGNQIFVNKLTVTL
ncbi:hypothetical protein ASE55_18075 [Chryseobacterium sp. Leaf201]|nr:hypothetical protein ASE55_18075 [Chryseobacterium sp. Leaf201]